MLKLKISLWDSITGDEVSVLELTEADISKIKRQRPGLILTDWLKACGEIDLEFIYQEDLNAAETLSPALAAAIAADQDGSQARHPAGHSKFYLWLLGLFETLRRGMGSP